MRDESHRLLSPAVAAAQDATPHGSGAIERYAADEEKGIDARPGIYYRAVTTESAESGTDNATLYKGCVVFSEAAMIYCWEGRRCIY
jgi:hypothetical protein